MKLIHLHNNWQPYNSRSQFVFFIFLLLLVSLAGCAEDTPSPVEPIIPEAEYSFFVAGHTYGRPGVDNIGLHPPFVSAIEESGLEQFSFGVLTGDIVKTPSASDWDEVDTQVVEFGCPVHFSVGNHDMYDRDLFTSRYGSTWHAFRHEGDLFIILDGEEEGGSLTGEQFNFLSAELEASDYHRIFLFVHKLIWIHDDTPWSPLRGFLNSGEGYDYTNNYWSHVQPLLQDTGVPVYLIAGDVGVVWAMALFFQQGGNITYIASGMGGDREENYLEVSISGAAVEITAVRLDGQPLELSNIEAYNLEHYVP